MHQQDRACAKEDLGEEDIDVCRAQFFTHKLGVFKDLHKLLTIHFRTPASKSCEGIYLYEYNSVNVLANAACLQPLTPDNRGRQHKLGVLTFKPENAVKRLKHRSSHLFPRL